MFDVWNISASGRSRSRSAAFSQSAAQEVGRHGSGDGAQEPLPNPNQPLSHELPGYIAPLPSELAVSVSTDQPHRKRKWQSGSQGDKRPSPSYRRPAKHSRRGQNTLILNALWLTKWFVSWIKVTFFCYRFRCCSMFSVKDVSCDLVCCRNVCEGPIAGARRIRLCVCWDPQVWWTASKTFSYLLQLNSL